MNTLFGLTSNKSSSSGGDTLNYNPCTVGDSAVAGEDGKYKTLREAIDNNFNLIEFVGSTIETSNLLSLKSDTIINLNYWNLGLDNKLSNTINNYKCYINNGYITKPTNTVSIINLIESKNTVCDYVTFDLTNSNLSFIGSGIFNYCKFTFAPVLVADVMGIGSKINVGGGNFSYNYFNGELNNCEIIDNDSSLDYRIISNNAIINNLKISGLLKDNAILIRDVGSVINGLELELDVTMTVCKMQLSNSQINNFKSNKSLSTETRDVTDTGDTYVFDRASIVNLNIGDTNAGTKTITLKTNDNQISNCNVEADIVDSGIDNQYSYKLY